MRLMRHTFATSLLITIFTLWAHLHSVVLASELSVLQGLYRHANMDHQLSGSEFGFGARYAEQFNRNMFWFADGSLTFKTYSGAGKLTPGNNQDIRIGGGARMYLERWSEHMVPFASAHSRFQKTSQVSTLGNSILSLSESGIYYGGTLGLRLNLSSDFFLDIETPLFESALIARQNSVHTTMINGQIQREKSSKNRQELALQSQGILKDFLISVGMRF
ncbi:MAG: hypothetical protein H6618_02385 [Deltaproteobacteria bacterium]|nr:hypothetical protein [Deltaproteobacteria bacterium]